MKVLKIVDKFYYNFNKLSLKLILFFLLCRLKSYHANGCWYAYYFISTKQTTFSQTTNLNFLLMKNPMILHPSKMLFTINKDGNIPKQRSTSIILIMDEPTDKVRYGALLIIMIICLDFSRLLT